METIQEGDHQHVRSRNVGILPFGLCYHIRRVIQPWDDVHDRVFPDQHRKITEYCDVVGA